MPQKKRANRSKMTKMKKTASKSKKNSHNMIASAERLEKDFRSMPAKIATCYRSELMTVKHQETKLKTELKKAQADQMSSQKKMATLAKAKTKTAANKKMMAAAKKVKDRAGKSAKDLASKLSQVHKTMLALDGKQAKFTALGKILGQLESQLAKKTAKKPAKLAKKSGKKAVKRAKQKSVALENTGNTSQEMPPMISSSNNMSDDNVDMK